MDLLNPLLALNRAGIVSSKRLLNLLDHVKDPALLLQCDAQQLRGYGFSDLQIKRLAKPDWHGVEQDHLWATQSKNHHIITLWDKSYPFLLKEISDPPYILFIQGDLKLLNNQQIAIVGSRNPSPAGAENAHAFAKQLAAQGFTITSGMASGIDTASHRGALCDTGTTIAVTGTGLNQVYPAQNKDLAAIIGSKGAIVSEFPIGMGAVKHNFPRRNRIISGLAMGVLVVEATLRSGSLITARQALDQGREVFAIPGSIHNPMARGCHQIIRQGAKLVETAGEIVAELVALIAYLDAQQLNHQGHTKLDATHQDLLGCVGFETTSIDVLIKRSGLAWHTLSTMLLQLEMQTMIRAVPGGYVRCK